MQLLSESVLIAVVGGCLGLPVGWAFKSLVASTIPENELPFWMSFDFDATVVAFSAGLCLLSGLLFGTLPALQISRADDIDALRGAGHRTAGSRRGRLLSRGLVVGEVTLAMVLLIGSGLLMQGYLYKRTVDLGFDREGVLTIDLELPQEQYSSKTVHFAPRLPEASHGPSRLWRGTSPLAAFGPGTAR
ncbi:MAG TPA: FtsX-like permease family protein [Acidobacteriota bacterium]|nr:FtsX-like permease family protein [Acidobacteriota bacterium]